MGTVLATICGLETEYNWYYQACNKCAGRIKLIAGRMFCERCKQSRNAIPRFVWCFIVVFYSCIVQKV